MCKSSSVTLCVTLASQSPACKLAANLTNGSFFAVFNGFRIALSTALDSFLLSISPQFYKQLLRVHIFSVAQSLFHQQFLGVIAPVGMPNWWYFCVKLLNSILFAVHQKIDVKLLEQKVGATVDEIDPLLIPFWYIFSCFANIYQRFRASGTYSGVIRMNNVFCSSSFSPVFRRHTTRSKKDRARCEWKERPPFILLPIMVPLSLTHKHTHTLNLSFSLSLKLPSLTNKNPHTHTRTHAPCVLLKWDAKSTLLWWWL